MTDTNLLDELDDEQYILFSYKVTTPSTTQTYVFDPFELTINQVSAWKYWWE